MDVYQGSVLLNNTVMDLNSC